jgi:hypothetical protein
MSDAATKRRKAEEKAALRQALADNDLSKEFAEWLTRKEGSGVSALREWARYFPGDDGSERQERAVKALLAKQPVADYKADGAQHELAIARIRGSVLWSSRQVDSSLAAGGSGEAPQTADEWDAPLPTSVSGPLEVTWKEQHPNLEWDLHGTPADRTVARIHREFTRDKAELRDLSKVKSMFHLCTPSKERKVPIGGGVQLSTGEADDDIEITSVVLYFWQLLIYMRACARAGAYRFTSRETRASVIFAPLSPLEQYAHNALRLTVESGVPSGRQLSWFKRNDLTTRGTTTQYLRQGFTAGESLAKSLMDHDNIWRPVAPEAPRLPAKEEPSDDEGRRGRPRAKGGAKGREPRPPRSRSPRAKGGGKGDGGGGGGARAAGPRGAGAPRVKWAKYTENNEWICEKFQQGKCPAKKQAK